MRKPTTTFAGRAARAAAAFFFAAALSGCDAGDAVVNIDKRPAAADSVVAEIQKRGALRVGMSSFIPWAMRDKNGEFIGFEVDVARAVAEDLGVALELVPTAWDGIITALLAGKFDVIIGGMSITPQRNLKINFSAPYARSGHGLFANRALAGGMTALDDFNREDVVIAMRRGIAAVDTVRRLLPRATVRQFDDEATVILEVVNGNAHASVTSEPTPAFAALDYPGKIFLPIKEKFDPYAAGFGIRKGDADALNFFNNWILVRAQSGWLQARHDYWFQTRDWAAMVGDES